MKHLIFGLGSIGQRHAANLLRAGETVLAVDPFVQGRFAFPVYRNPEDGWNNQPDLVWICTPTDMHAEQVIGALKRGRHVFVEKPLSHDLDSAQAVIDTWMKLRDKKMIWVACNMRFHPAVRKMKNLLDTGIIGKPLIYRFFSLIF